MIQVSSIKYVHVLYIGSDIEIVVPDASLAKTPHASRFGRTTTANSHIGALLPSMIVQGAEITVVLKIEMPLAVS